MKISLNWLNEWIEVRDIAVNELAHALTMAGLEVDAIEQRGEDCGIVVGLIEKIDAHPKADRLVLCTVNIGQAETLQIVCGAKNMKAGDRVPVALNGSKPPGIDFEIVERKVMGTLSQGMLCSEEELALAKESEGLLILDADMELGQPIFDALGLRDTVLHIGLTPNRADCLSHLGVAREVSAIYGRPLRAERLQLEAPLWETSEGTAVADAVRLTVEDEVGCPSYSLAVLEDVTVGESPMWLRRRLLSVGMRRVNNIVDVTNFVMMDVGQPLHAFDLDKLEGREIIVRRARAGEKMVGIDHREYVLSEEDLVIADAQKPVAIAGVMGGVDTEVSEATRRILLECAYFDPRTVRKSARRHAMHTDSSHRFERGIERATIVENLQRAASVLVKADSASASVGQGILHQEVAGFVKESKIRLEYSHPNRLLGTEISREQATGYLKSLGLQVEEQEYAWLVGIPSRRGDLERPVDLIEEIARLHGYDHIPSRLPSGSLGYTHRLREDSKERETIVSRKDRQTLRWMRTLLLDQGLYEVVNYSFMSEADLDALLLSADDSRRQAPVIGNPLVKSHGLMRTTLLPGLLANLRTNRAQRLENIALFEVGRRYRKDGEHRTLGILLTGERSPHWGQSAHWDFYDLKGLVEALAQPFDVSAGQWAPAEVLEPFLHPGVQADWTVNGQKVATIGQLHPEIAQREELERPVFLAEIDVEALLSMGERAIRLQALPRFPASSRDFALIYDRDKPYAHLREAIDELARRDASFGALLESVELFDLYQGAQIPADKRSLALSVVYRLADRTLTEAEVEQADRVLLEWLAAEVGATLR